MNADEAARDPRAFLQQININSDYVPPASEQTLRIVDEEVIRVSEYANRLAHAALQIRSALNARDY
ncbi:MAG: hypothetical protein AAGJ46_10125 [Planctomycetota bacterium]